MLNKEENEKLLDVLELARSHIVELCTVMNIPLPAATIRRIDSALSQQAEPAPAQGERKAYSAWCDSNTRNRRTDTNGYHAFKAGAAWQRTRPAQKVKVVDTPEQQPAMTAELRRFGPEDWQVYWAVDKDDAPLFGRPLYYRNFKVGDKVQLYAAPIAQTTPQGYVLLPKQCPSWLEDVYDDCCQGDSSLYLPAYDAMVKALEDHQKGLLKKG